MTAPKSGPEYKTIKKPLRLVRSGRTLEVPHRENSTLLAPVDLYEIEPQPMSADQLKAAAIKYFKRELPKRTGRQALMQWRMQQKALLFGGTLKQSGWSDEDLRPPLDKPLTWDVTRLARLIERAMAGDGNADILLRDAANVFLDRDMLPPKELRAYVKTRFRGKRTNQRTHGELGLRNHAIAYCIKQVLRHSRDSIEAMRSDATKERTESACSIVAEAYEAAISGMMHDITKAFEDGKIGVDEHNKQMKALGKSLKEKSFNVIWTSLQKRYSPSMVTARRTKPDR